ncbi:hypothetical protein POTOM_021952 [Populus tomentosa]|uniref:Chromatin modification-related protein MEAF6-like n=1 Tax=Populus tomentosa TaxID=118781 RepID=A0A8X8D1V8_POPTO|nr:hypothetical protein POTOM_021952 [Populus tomentosa]
MDPEGHRGSSNPAAMLANLLNKRAKLHEELRVIERQVYDLETSYLQDPGQCGNVLKGFEGFLSSSKNTALLKRSRKFQPEDRLFSLSSVTSPAGNALCIALLKDPVSFCAESVCNALKLLMLHAEEQAAGRDDGRSEFGVGRSKGGGIYANGQGKPKKGRGASRDSKRIRPSADPDFDYDDDADLTL